MSTTNYKNRNYVYAFPSVNGTTIVINYSGSPEVNTFLWHFDIWKCNGHHKLCSDGNHSKVEFECTRNFLSLCQTPEFKEAFKHMGVKLTLDAKEIFDID